MWRFFRKGGTNMACNNKMEWNHTSFYGEMLKNAESIKIGICANTRISIHNRFITLYLIVALQSQEDEPHGYLHNMFLNSSCLYRNVCYFNAKNCCEKVSNHSGSEATMCCKNRPWGQTPAKLMSPISPLTRS